MSRRPDYRTRDERFNERLLWIAGVAYVLAPVVGALGDWLNP